MTSKIDIFFGKLLAIEANLKFSGLENNRIQELSWDLYKCYSIHYYKPRIKHEIEQVEVNAYLNNLYNIIKDSKALIPDSWAQYLIDQILIEISLILYEFKYGKV